MNNLTQRGVFEAGVRGVWLKNLKELVAKDDAKYFENKPSWEETLSKKIKRRVKDREEYLRIVRRNSLCKFWGKIFNNWFGKKN